MEGRQRLSFTDDYKRQALDLVASSGRSIGSVAKELGLRDSCSSLIGRLRRPNGTEAGQRRGRRHRHRIKDAHGCG